MNWQDLIRFIFGESISVSSVAAPAVAIFLPIVQIFYNRMRNKLINTKITDTQKDKQISELKEQIDNQNQAISFLSNMLCTAYLSSNTIPPETKKVIASYAEKLDKIANIELTKEASKLIDAVSAFVPNVNDKKEELLEITENAEKIIDEANEATKLAIDKLKI